MRFLIPSLIASALCIVCAQAQKVDGAKFQNVDAKEAQALLADKSKPVTVLDVRTPAEFAAGKLAGAELIDYKSADFATKLGELDKSKTYLVHCRSGRRSMGALEKMKELGFKSVYHLDGGILAWEEGGGKVERKSSSTGD